MQRPVRVGYVSISQAISMIIVEHFADRHNVIENQHESEIAAYAKSSNFFEGQMEEINPLDPFRPSPILQKRIDEVFSDAQYMLRQWLCDGQIAAFYRDPAAGEGYVKVDAAAWETEATDEAINGKPFYPCGRVIDRSNGNTGFPVRIVRSDLERLLRGHPSASQAVNRPSVGAPKTVVLRVMQAMREAPRHHWVGVSLESMAATFRAAPGTVKKAREALLQQLDDKPIED